MKRHVMDFAAKFGGLQQSEVSSIKGGIHRAVVATFRSRYAAASALQAKQLLPCHGVCPYAIPWEPADFEQGE